MLIFIAILLIGIFLFVVAQNKQDKINILFGTMMVILIATLLFQIFAMQTSDSSPVLPVQNNNIYSLQKLNSENYYEQIYIKNSKPVKRAIICKVSYNHIDTYILLPPELVGDIKEGGKPSLKIYYKKYGNFWLTLDSWEVVEKYEITIPKK